MTRRTDIPDVFERIVERIGEPDPDDVGSSAEGSSTVPDATDARAGNAPADDTEKAIGDEINSDVDAADVDSADADAAEADPSDADAADDGGAGERSARSRLRRVLRWTALGAAIAIFIAALATSGFLFWQLKQTQATEAAGEAALNTAKSYAVTLSSVDTKDIDTNFAQVLDGATGEFKDMYSQSSAQLRQLLVDNKAESRGVVIDAGIKSATKSKVEVMLFIDQSISNSVTPEPRIDRLRMTMTMNLIDGRWLAGHIEIS